MPDYFQIDLGRTQWRPSGLEALRHEIARAFGGRAETSEVEFYGVSGSNGSGRQVQIATDEDLQGFCGAAGGGGEGGEEDQAVPHQAADVLAPKVLRATLPEQLAAELRQPRRLAVLATGRQQGKYSGEVGGKDRVEISLKLFDCGHFRLKETAASGGLSPAAQAARAWVLEGRWEAQPKGVKLEFLLRFSEGGRRRGDAGITYEGVAQEGVTGVLSYGAAGSEDELRGSLPTSSGEGGQSWVQLHREVDVLARQARRQGDDDEDDWECQQLLRHQAGSPRPASTPYKPRREWEEWESDEPTWPMYLGIFLFIVIFCVFAWVWYEERYHPEIKQEFDEL